MSTAAMSLLPANPPMTQRVRAYFAPVNRSTSTPTLFDPAQFGEFALDTPPTPWMDLGWVEKFQRKSASKMGVMLSGSPATVQSQMREELDATVSLQFLNWGKLQMALTAGSQHMNLLQAQAGSPASGSGGAGIAATPLQAGSTATQLNLTATQTAQFSVGQMVAVDVDYTGQTGFVGSGVSAAYVKSSAAVQNDVNYIRRVTYNVGRIVAVNSTNVQLGEPLLAGAPAAGMAVQPIVGFVDREGGSFFQEWSALFVMQGEQGDRVLLHYPRLQAMASASEAAQVLTAPLERLSLSGTFRALPTTDATDGEQVLCFRSYLPAGTTQLW
ncbi:MAG: hypothetical protein ACYC46_07785 [Acidobacteriaceae bacterium]